MLILIDPSRYKRARREYGRAAGMKYPPDKNELQVLGAENPMVPITGQVP